MFFFFLNLLNDLVFRQGNERGDYARTLVVTTERSELMYRHSASLREIVVLRTINVSDFSCACSSHASCLSVLLFFFLLITVIQVGASRFHNPPPPLREVRDEVREFLPVLLYSKKSMKYGKHGFHSYVHTYIYHS